MKILYVDYPHNLSEDQTFRYYGDLYRELVKTENVVVHPPGIFDMPSLHQAGFECIVFGLGYFTQTDLSYYAEQKGLKESNIVKVSMLHKLGHNLQNKVQFCKDNNFDLIMDPHITYKEHATQSGCESFRFWFNADPKIFHPREINKLYDVGFSGASHPNGKERTKNSPTNNLRNRVHQALLMKDYNIYWNMDPTDKNHKRISSLEEYASLMNKSKIWLATTGPFLDVGPRYFEVMMSKTLLLCNKMPEEYEGVFIDGYNCVMFENDLSDFYQKLDYYLNNDEERNIIINNAYEFVMANHTVKNMADKFNQKIRELKHAKRNL